MKYAIAITVLIIGLMGCGIKSKPTETTSSAQKVYVLIPGTYEWEDVRAAGSNHNEIYKPHVTGEKLGELIMSRVKGQILDRQLILLESDIKTLSKSDPEKMEKIKEKEKIEEKIVRHDDTLTQVEEKVVDIWLKSLSFTLIWDETAKEYHILNLNIITNRDENIPKRKENGQDLGGEYEKPIIDHIHLYFDFGQKICVCKSQQEKIFVLNKKVEFDSATGTFSFSFMHGHAVKEKMQKYVFKGAASELKALEWRPDFFKVVLEGAIEVWSGGSKPEFLQFGHWKAAQIIEPPFPKNEPKVQK